jgi:heat shock protein HslJ
MKPFYLVFTLFLGLSLNACNSGAEKQAEEAVEEAAETVEQAAEDVKEAVKPKAKTWKLVSYGETGSLNTYEGQQPITLQMNMKEQKISGSGGCNNYFGGMETTEQGFRFTGMGSTKKACPAEVMKMEDMYMKMLQKANGFNIEDGQLIMDVEGGKQMVFASM